MTVRHPGSHCVHCIYQDPPKAAAEYGGCKYPQKPPENDPGNGGLFGPGSQPCAHYRVKVNCGGCRFYMATQNTPGEQYGRCRRRAPVANPPGHPHIAPDYWCGDWTKP